MSEIYNKLNNEMKTKPEIVERLLENGHITAEEAVVLLKEAEFIEKPSIKQYPYEPLDLGLGDAEMVPYGTICSCNPANGGSGICGCVMGNKLVPKNYNNTKGNINGLGNNLTNNDGMCYNKVCFCTGKCKA